MKLVPKDNGIVKYADQTFKTFNDGLYIFINVIKGCEMLNIAFN